MRKSESSEKDQSVDDRENLNGSSKPFAWAVSGAFCEDPETRGSRNREGRECVHSGAGRPVGIQ